MNSGKTPLITIVMVTHNEGRYLKESMPALFNQSMPDFEVVLMDNGSTDDTEQVIAGLNDERVRVFRNENLGLGLAYNVGISQARGKWISLGNADDLCYPRKLEKQVEAFEKASVGVVFTEAELIDDSGKIVAAELAARFPFSFENLPPLQMYEKLFFRTNFLCAPSAVIRKDLLLARPFDPMLIQLQDFDMWFNLIQKVDFEIIPEKLIGYRVRLDGSNISLNTANRSRVLLELSVVYRRFFDGVDIEFFRCAFARHLRNPQFQGSIAFEFEKAFLYLKMQEPAIRNIGLEMLYALMSRDESRALGGSQYDLNMRDVWQLALTPVYADAKVIGESAANFIELSEELKTTQAELRANREMMRSITSGKLWRLREKVYGILRGSSRS